VVFLVAFNPTHIGHYLRPPYADVADASKALSLVPPGAQLVTHDEWFVHVAYSHRNATTYFCPYETYAVYADDFAGTYFQHDIRPELEAEVSDGRTQVVATFGKVKVYKRRPPPGAHVGNCITPGDSRYRPPLEAVGWKG
jgi:hypothetical protein